MAKFITASDSLDGTLALAYGIHVVSGHIIQKVTVGAGDDAQTTLIVWLGEGVWNRIVHAYWAGGEITSNDYHFHNGFLSNSMDEAVLGKQIQQNLIIGTVSSSGNARATITAAGMAGSPKIIDFAVVSGDTPAEIAAKAKAALLADTDVTGFLNVTGDKNRVRITAKVSAANDATMNVRIQNQTSAGITTTDSVNINQGNSTDWTQGVDPWNVGGQTYSGTAYVVIKLPVGVAGDDDFGKLKFICECLRVADYDVSGQQLNSVGTVVGAAGDAPNPAYFFYSTNPALAMADLLLVRRKISKDRINWNFWTEWRDFNDVEIDWVGGNIPDRPTFQNVTNWIEGADAGGIKAYGLENVWDAGAFTTSSIASGVNGFFEADIGTGNLLIGLSTTNTVVVTNGAADFDICLLFRPNGNVELFDGVTSKGVISNWVTGDRFRVAVDNGVYVISKYGVVIDTSSLALSTPSYPLYGGVEGFNIGSEILRSTMNPAGDVSAERTRKRFECGLAFPNQTDISTAIEAILYISCAEMQDGEKLLFLPPTMASAPRTSVFDFDNSNIIPGTFKVFRLAREQKPTKMIGRFRDIDTATLKEDTVPVDRDALVTLLGRENPAPEVYLGSITRGQAQCILNYYMRRMSDLDLYCSFQAKGTSWKVMPGDVVQVSEESEEWIDVKFEVTESTDESSIDTPDFRTFTCQIFNENTYSDTDQTALVANVASSRVDIISPNQFLGFFDSITGDLLLEWNSRTRFDNPAFESYTIQVLDTDNTTPLRTQKINPLMNSQLQEYVVWNPVIYNISGPLIPPTDYAELIEDGGVRFVQSFVGTNVVSLTGAEVVGGLLVEFQIPGDGKVTPFIMSVFPENSIGVSFDNAFIWYTQRDPTDHIWYVIPEEGPVTNPLRRPLKSGDRLGIYIRPDGLVEYHINYNPSSQPILLSGRPIDITQKYKVYLQDGGNHSFSTGKEVLKVSWMRQGPEWKYIAGAQRIDFGLGSGDPLPTTILGRVRQNSPFVAGVPSDWTYGVFVR